MLRWSDYLLNEALAPSPAPPLPAAADFLDANFGPASGLGDHWKDWAAGKPLATQAGALLEVSSRMSAGGRDTAAELERMERLLIPLDHPGKAAAPTADDRSRAIQQLAIWSSEGTGFQAARTRGLAGSEAATLLNGDSRFEEAVKLCLRVEDFAKGTEGSKRCQDLRASIQAPWLTLGARQTPPGGKGAFVVGARNVPEVRLRAFRVTVEELSARHAKLFPNAVKGADWSALRWLPPDAIGDVPLAPPGRGVVRSSESGGALRAGRGHGADFPDAKPGLYVVIASSDPQFERGKSLLASMIVPVADFVLVGSSAFHGRPGRSLRFRRSLAESRAGDFRLTAIDWKTGAPLPAVGIDARDQARPAS